MSHTIQRLRLTVAEVTYPLAPTEHLEVLKTAIKDAVRSGGDFVDIVVDTGEHLSILVTTSSVVTISAETVRMDTGTADGEAEARKWLPTSFGAFDTDMDTPLDWI